MRLVAGLLVVLIGSQLHKGAGVASIEHRTLTSVSEVRNAEHPRSQLNQFLLMRGRPYLNMWTKLADFHSGLI